MLYLVKRSLSPQVFSEIRNGISFDLHHSCVVDCAGCGVGVYANGMIHKIGSKRRILNLRVLQISGQLMHDCTDHLQMPQLFCTERRVKMEPESKI